MIELAAVVIVENDRRSSGGPWRNAAQMPATLIMGSFCRWIFNGRLRWPSLFHSKNPLNGTMLLALKHRHHIRFRNV